MAMPAAPPEVQQRPGAAQRELCRELGCEELAAATQQWHASRRLGGGSFGSVYRGELGDGSPVAVKVLDWAGLSHPEAAAVFQEEVQLLSALRHPNLVTLLGWGRKDSQRCLVYEFLGGGNVFQRLLNCKQQGGAQAFHWSTRLSVCTDAAAGLSRMHSSKALHRNVRSSCILLDQHGTAKVADFGLSCTSGTVTMGAACGSISPGYTCPVYQRTGQFTEGSEVYAFGIVLLELLTGLAPVMADPQRHNVLVCPLANTLAPHQPGAANRCAQNLDAAAGWPPQLAGELAALALRCVDIQEEAQRPRLADALRALRGLAERLAEESGAGQVAPAVANGAACSTPPFYLECVKAACVSVDKLPLEQRRLPLWLGGAVNEPAGSSPSVSVGRVHQVDIFEAWLPDEQLRTCVSRTAFEVLWSPGGDGLSLVVRGTNPLSVDRQPVQQGAAVPLRPGAEVAFNYSAPGQQEPFLLLRLQASSPTPAWAAPSSGAGLAAASPSPPAQAPTPDVCCWRLTCLHCEGLAGERLQALPQSARQIEIPVGTLLVGRERQPQFFEALLAASPHLLTFISRTHLELVARPDLGGLTATNVSANAVYVDREPLARGQARTLAREQVISFARPEGAEGNVRHVHFLVLQLQASPAAREAGCRERRATAPAPAPQPPPAPAGAREPPEAQAPAAAAVVPATAAPPAAAPAAAAAAPAATPAPAPAPAPLAAPVQPAATVEVGAEAAAERCPLPPPAAPPPPGPPPVLPPPSPFVVPTPQPAVLPVPSPTPRSAPPQPAQGVLADAAAAAGSPSQQHAAAAGAAGGYPASPSAPSRPLLCQPDEPPEPRRRGEVEVPPEPPEAPAQHASLAERPAVQLPAAALVPSARSPTPSPTAEDFRPEPCQARFPAEADISMPTVEVMLELSGEGVLDVPLEERRIGPAALAGTPLVVGRRHQTELLRRVVRKECLQFLSRDHFRISRSEGCFWLHVLTPNPIWIYRAGEDPIELASEEVSQLRPDDIIALGTGGEDYFTSAEDARRRLSWRFRALGPGEASPAARSSPSSEGRCAEPASPGGPGPRVSVGPWSQRQVPTLGMAPSSSAPPAAHAAPAAAAAPAADAAAPASEPALRPAPTLGAGLDGLPSAFEAEPPPPAGARGASSLTAFGPALAGGSPLAGGREERRWSAPCVPQAREERPSELCSPVPRLLGSCGGADPPPKAQRERGCELPSLAEEAAPRGLGGSEAQLPCFGGQGSLLQGALEDCPPPSFGGVFPRPRGERLQGFEARDALGEDFALYSRVSQADQARRDQYRNREPFSFSR